MKRRAVIDNAYTVALSSHLSEREERGEREKRDKRAKREKRKNREKRKKREKRGEREEIEERRERREREEREERELCSTSPPRGNQVDGLPRGVSTEAVRASRQVGGVSDNRYK